MVCFPSYRDRTDIDIFAEKLKPSFLIASNDDPEPRSGDVSRIIRRQRAAKRRQIGAPGRKPRGSGRRATKAAKDIRFTKPFLCGFRLPTRRGAQRKMIF